MAEGRRGLGRGLSALLDETEAASTAEGRRSAGALEAAIELIRPNPGQPRRTFGETEMAELTASILKRGIVQPILGRPMPEAPGEYQIVAGERRWRAAQRAGLHSIPIMVRDLDDLQVIEVALIENLQRADLNAMEEARTYAAMTKRYSRSHDAIADIVGKSRSHVANMVRLLRLPESVRTHLEEGRLTAGHARALLDADDAEALAERIIQQGLNVRQAETLGRISRAAREEPTRAALPKASSSADTRMLERDLSETVGLTVRIHGSGNKGEVRISYSSFEQLDDVCRRLTRPLPVPKNALQT